MWKARLSSALVLVKMRRVGGVRVRIYMYSYRRVSAHLIASGRSLVVGGEGESAYVCHVTHVRLTQVYFSCIHVNGLKKPVT